MVPDGGRAIPDPGLGGWSRGEPLLPLFVTYCTVTAAYRMLPDRVGG